MPTIERPAQPSAARYEHAHATQRRLRWGARWVSVRADAAQDLRALRPEDVARGELFYNSTCCWV